MNLSSWRSRWESHPSKSKVRPKAVMPWKAFALRCEALEDRTVPSTFTVMNLHDSGSGSLRAAITSANGTTGATINFAANLHGTIALTSGELDITSSTTVNGPGADKISVSGNNASRVLEIAAGQTVSIKGLTITDGFAADQGGGILNDGSNLTLTGDDITHNAVTQGTSSGGRGGGMRSLAGSVTISGCDIANNSAFGGTDPTQQDDGYGGGVYILAGNAAISDSTITGNTAQGGTGGYYDGGVGGGVFIATTATATLTRCTLSGNQALAGNGGAGQYIGEAGAGALNTNGSVTVSACTFDNNRAVGGSNSNSGPGVTDPFIDYAFGGAIDVTEGTLNIANSSFSHNQAIGGNNAAGTATDFAGVGGAEGGAIYAEVATTVTLSNSTLDQNQAIGGHGNTGSGPVVLVGKGLGGGIVSGYGGDAFGPTTLTVSNSSLTGNEAVGGNNNSGTATVSGLIGTGPAPASPTTQADWPPLAAAPMIGNQAIGGRNNTASGTGALAGLGTAAASSITLGVMSRPATAT